MVSTFSKKIKSLLDIKEKGLILGFLIIIPACITVMLYSIFIINFIQQSQSLLDLIMNPANMWIFFGVFFLAALVCYVIGYAYTRISMSSRAIENKSEIKNTLEKIINKLSNANIDNISIIKEELDEIKTLMINNDMENRLITVDEKLDSSILNKIPIMCDNLKDVKDKLLKANQVGYTVTCIPIKYDKDSKSLKMVLIQNKSHEKSAWMFPGSHIEVSENHFTDENIKLKTLEYVPDKIIVKKVREEAGIEKISLIDPNFKYAVPNNSKVTYPKTCWTVKAPVFNYLFKVSEYSRCYKNSGHRCHYDLTYIGEYEEFNSNPNAYPAVEVEFDSKIKFDEETRIADIQSIRTVLEQTINKRLNNSEEYETINNLCLDSIPQMIYNAGAFYKEFKRLIDRG